MTRVGLRYRLLKGEAEGHPFRGNQHTGGIPGYDTIKRMKKVKGPLGSQGGQWYEDAEGQRYLVKPGKSEDHVQNEIAGGIVYRMAGVHFPLTRFDHDDSGRPVIISKKIEGLRQASASEWASNATLQERAARDFGIDAWLSHWDVHGLEQDNTLVDEAGMPVRIESGGAMAFRAMGGTKDSFSIGPWVEPETMRTSNQGKLMYGRMTDDQALSSLRRILDVDVDEVERAWLKAGISPSNASRWRMVLESRQLKVPSMGLGPNWDIDPLFGRRRKPRQKTYQEQRREAEDRARESLDAWRENFIAERARRRARKTKPSEWLIKGDYPGHPFRGNQYIKVPSAGNNPMPGVHGFHQTAKHPKYVNQLFFDHVSGGDSPTTKRLTQEFQRYMPNAKVQLKSDPSKWPPGWQVTGATEGVTEADIEAMAKTLRKVAQDFPETLRGLDAFRLGEYNATLGAECGGATTMGIAQQADSKYRFVHGIGLNSQHSPASSDQSMKTGWLATDSGLSGILLHEMGHAIYNRARQRWLTENLKLPEAGELWQFNGTVLHEGLDQSLGFPGAHSAPTPSEYAKDSGAEHFAETFAYMYADKYKVTKGKERKLNPYMMNMVTKVVAMAEHDAPVTKAEKPKIIAIVEFEQSCSGYPHDPALDDETVEDAERRASLRDRLLPE